MKTEFFLENMKAFTSCVQNEDEHLHSDLRWRNVSNRPIFRPLKQGATEPLKGDAYGYVGHDDYGVGQKNLGQLDAPQPQPPGTHY